MAQRWSLKQAFAHFGTAATNPVWGWSARSPDGKTVAVTIWQDQLADEGETVTVDKFGHPELVHWQSALGNRDRIRNLAWARDKCDGRFRVVMVEARDPRAIPRSIKRVYPHDTLIMRLADLSEETGEFRAISIQR